MEWKVIFMFRICLFGSVFVKTVLACPLYGVAEELYFRTG